MCDAPNQPAQVDEGAISRATTIDASLNGLDSPEASWSLRSVQANDFLLRSSFKRVLDESEAAEPSAKLIMYDACDEGEVRAPLGKCSRRRIDARRNTKPKKPNEQLQVCTPFDPKGFNFSKISNERERLLQLSLKVGAYDVLTNKFPLFPKHMLLVAKALVPQQMTHTHLAAICELLSASSFCAYFNSWCASASVNHFHCHLIDELPPVTEHPLVAGPLVSGFRCLQPQGFAGFCYVLPLSAVDVVSDAVAAMQKDNQPHNMLFTPRHIYVFPKPLARPERSFALYPETVGGPELIGSFTVYNEADYDALTLEAAEELVRINTAPLPSRLLQRGSGCGSSAIDDAAVHVDAAASTRATSRAFVPASRSIDCTLQEIDRQMTLDCLRQTYGPMRCISSESLTSAVC
jgi:hypothetical protein